jgi:hypothetical protein
MGIQVKLVISGCQFEALGGQVSVGDGGSVG